MTYGPDALLLERFEELWGLAWYTTVLGIAQLILELLLEFCRERSVA